MFGRGVFILFLKEMSILTKGSKIAWFSRAVTTHQRDDTLYAYTTKAPTDCPDAMGAMKIK